jgi:hypothetical protein
LGDAATHAGLKDAFVHVRELGDFAVNYRVAGLLEDVKSLISSRSRLRESMLDALHGEDIEIISPNFMNTRALSGKESIIPEPAQKIIKRKSPKADDMAFDKAAEAASVESIRKAIELNEAELEALENGKEVSASKEAEEQRKAAELAEHKGSTS